MRNDIVSDVMFNMMGKSPIFGPQLPNTATTVYTIDDVKQAVIDVASDYITGITKDRIKVSLVVDNEHTTALVIAVYFDINDPNFVQQADNEFGTIIQASNEKVKQFLNDYALKDKGGKPYDAMRFDRGIDGRKYRYIVLNVRKIFEYMADASGWGYKIYSGTRGRSMNIKVDVVKHYDGNGVTIDNFVVTKTLVPKRLKKLRDF